MLKKFKEDWVSSSRLVKAKFLLMIVLVMSFGVSGIIYAVRFANSVDNGVVDYHYAVYAWVLGIITLLLGYIKVKPVKK